MKKCFRIASIIMALACAASSAPAPTAPVPATQPLTNMQLRQCLTRDVREIVSDNGTIKGLLGFLTNQFSMPLEVDWPELQKVGVTPLSGITLSVKNVPVERALLEALEQAARDRLTYVLDRGTLRIRTKDDSRAGRHEAAAALVDQAQISLEDGDTATGAALLAQAHIIEPALNPELLPKALARIAPPQEPMNFSADGRVHVLTPRDAWLKAHAAAQARLDAILQDLTVEQQRLVLVLYYFRDTMGIQGQYVDWPQLEKLGVTRDSAVTLHIKNQPAGQSLAAILAAVGKDKLGFVNDDGILTISSIEDLENAPRYQRIWVYDVRALITPSGTGPDADLDRQERSRKLQAIVKSAADEKSWARGSRYVEEFEGLLFVRQDDPNHVKIAQRLSELKKL